MAALRHSSNAWLSLRQKKTSYRRGGVVTGSLQATSGNTALLLLPTLNTQGVCRKDFFLSTYIETTESEKSSRKMNFFLFFFWQVSRKKNRRPRGTVTGLLHTVPGHSTAIIANTQHTRSLQEVFSSLHILRQQNLKKVPNDVKKIQNS